MFGVKGYSFTDFVSQTEYLGVFNYNKMARNPNHSQTFHLYVKYYLSEKKFYPNARFCWNNLKQKYEVTYHFIMPSTLNKAGYTPLDYPKYSFRELFTKQEVLNG